MFPRIFSGIKISSQNWLEGFFVWFCDIGKIESVEQLVIKSILLLKDVIEK